MKNHYINFIKPGTGSMNGLSGTIHPTMAALQKRRAFCWVYNGKPDHAMISRQWKTDTGNIFFGKREL